MRLSRKKNKPAKRGNLNILDFANFATTTEHIEQTEIFIQNCFIWYNAKMECMKTKRSEHESNKKATLIKISKLSNELL